MSEFDIVPAAALGDHGEIEARLEPLARRVFGDGERRPGWLGLKLEREGVDPRLSMVAVDAGRPYGYVLVGTPLPGIARTAGVGVEPGRRGRGVGSDLLLHAARAAQRQGLASLRTLAAVHRVGFYARAGFVRCRTNHSLLNFCEGDASSESDALPPPRAWDDIGDCTHEHAAWMQMAWERTPARARTTLALGPGAVVHLSREGHAHLVHRLTTKSADEEAVLGTVAALLKRLARPAPILLYGCNAVSSITSSLMREGWVVAQSAVVMEKPLDR